jgi:hypothetical protein
MFCHERQGQHTTYDVFTGVLSSNGTKDTIRFKDHIFVGDTKDGGAAVWMRHVGSEQAQPAVPCYVGWRHETPSVDPTEMTQKARARFLSAEPSNPVYCHCKGISLVLHRQHGTAHHDKFQVQADTSAASCHFTGTEMMHWAVISMELIESTTAVSPSPLPTPRPAGSSPTADLKQCADGSGQNRRFGTLGSYSSLDGIEYYFCSRCSSSVFVVDRKHPQVAWLAAGLIESQTGARAENQLRWNAGVERKVTQEPTHDMEEWRAKLVHAVKADILTWGEREH